MCATSVILEKLPKEKSRPTWQKFALSGHPAQDRGQSMYVKEEGKNVFSKNLWRAVRKIFGNQKQAVPCPSLLLYRFYEKIFHKYVLQKKNIFPP
jgi:hypothetical protein